MTFLSGFAEGFINERNRRLDQQKEMDQLALKYRLESLQQDKTLRDKKKEEEQKILETSKALSSTLGAEDMAPAVATMLKSGMSPDDIRTAYINGQIRKKPVGQITIQAQNPNLTPNTDTSTSTVPTGVTPTTATPMNVPAGVQPTNTSTTPVAQVDQNAVVAKPTFIDQIYGTPDTSLTKNSTPNLNAIDQKIKGFAPNLFDTATPGSKPDNLSLSNSNYEYVPGTIEKKLDDAATTQYKLLGYQKDYSNAQATHDVAGMQMAQAKIDDYKMRMQAITMAHVLATKGTLPANQATYFSVDKNGNMGNMFIGQDEVDENGNHVLRNVSPSSDNYNKIVTTGAVPMPDSVFKYYTQVSEKVGEKLNNYNNQRAALITAMSTANKIDDIVKRSPDVTNLAGSVDATVNWLSTTVSSLSGMYQNLGASAKDIEDSIAKNDPGVMDKIAQFQKQIDSVVTSKMRQTGDDKIVYNALKLSMAYQLAAANSQTGTALSQKEVDQFKTQIDGSTPQQVTNLMNQQLSLSFNNTQSNYAGLKNDVGAANNTLKKLLPGVKNTGLEPIRIGDIIQQMGLSPEDAAKLTNRLKVISSNTIPAQRADLVNQPEAAPQQNQQTTGNIPTVSSEEELMKLPSGTKAQVYDPASKQYITVVRP